MQMKGRWAMMVFLMSMTAACAFTLPLIGIEPIRPADVFLGLTGYQHDIFWSLRLPRIGTGMIAGAVLAAAGLVFQSVFRNPLATPFTLGTASGASLGASAYLALGGVSTVLGMPGLTVAAFFGAFLALAMVYGFARIKHGTTTDTLLLAGVGVSIFFSSLILLLQYLTNQAHSLRILRWLMGGLEVVGYGPMVQILLIAMPGFILLLYLRWELNLFATGEELAASRGVSVQRAKLLLLGTAGIMVGAVVAVAGPVGFIGLIVPHICRRLFGPDHRWLLPGAILFGACFLPICDTLARLVLAPAELPVGIITALLGGPFFLWILIAKDAPGR